MVKTCQVTAQLPPDHLRRSFLLQARCGPGEPLARPCLPRPSQRKLPSVFLPDCNCSPSRQMAAPSIPNLLSLRGSGRGGGRGGRGRRQAGPSASSTGVSPDATIQGTDTDAAVSRLSAVQLGYLEDPYARFFVTGPPTRRLPIINRGPYRSTKTTITPV